MRVQIAQEVVVTKHYGGGKNSESTSRKVEILGLWMAETASHRLSSVPF